VIPCIPRLEPGTRVRTVKPIRYGCLIQPGTGTVLYGPQGDDECYSVRFDTGLTRFVPGDELIEEPEIREEDS